MKNRFSTIEEWVNRKGYYVETSSTCQDEVCFNTKKIIINSRQSSKNMLYSLLHEAGHILIDKNTKSFLNRASIYPPIINDKRKKRSVKYRVSLISEELEAWKRGFTLAKKLKVNIDKEDYFDQMNKNVWTYIKWAAN